MKFTLNNQQIIIIFLIIFFAFLVYQIYSIKVKEYMTTKNKLKRSMHSETKNIEDTNIPEVHISIQDINTQLGENELNNETIKIIDKYGNIENIIISKTFGNPTYYKPGRYKYGSQSYLPTYEDSIFLSKSFNPLPN